MNLLIDAWIPVRLQEGGIPQKITLQTLLCEQQKWVLSLPNFNGKREDCNEGHLEQIQSTWVYEWRDNQ